MVIRVEKMVDINKEGGDVGVWPWGSESPVFNDNIRLLTMRPSGMQKSLEGTKKGDSGDSMQSQVACSPAVKARKFLGVCYCCYMQSCLTNEKLF